MSGAPAQDFHGVTTLHPLGIAAACLLGMLVLILPRRRDVVVVILVLACFVPVAQRLVIAGLDFDLLRIITLVAWVRLLARGEVQRVGLCGLDVAIVACALSGVLIMSLREASVDAFVNRLGWAFDSIVGYAIFRQLLRSIDDVRFVAKALCWLVLPVTCFFVFEYVTHHNVFALFGGVNEFTTVREGRLRCMGAFAHPIIAGCFWVSVMPLMGALLWSRRAGSVLAALGLAASMVVVYTCGSSTPILGLLAGVAGTSLFWVRRYMSLIRWGSAIMLVTLHFSMQAPVWHLISRLDVVGGSTGWHRYYLIDQAIKRLSEWWLLGSPGTSHWGHHLFDTTNHYIVIGVEGGLLTLVLFIVTIVAAFRMIGRAMRREEMVPEDAVLAWVVGVSLFIHCACFLAVSYFGQIWILWNMVLAMIPALGAQLPSRAGRTRAAAGASLAAGERSRLSVIQQPTSAASRHGSSHAAIP